MSRQEIYEASRQQIRVLLENSERVSPGNVGRMRAADVRRQAEAAELAVSGEGRQ